MASFKLAKDYKNPVPINGLWESVWTPQQNGSQIFDDGGRRRTGRWQGEAGLLSTPPDGNFPMQNIGQVNFESPKVPVIFVLGGPGSGKVTHCDNLMHEKKGITHINMTDILQQYAMGNDMLDFGLLSSKTVAEVLMLEMKMSPNAKTFLVSGYPRNMRDVVEYSEKIQIVNGVVLVSWRQEILERQIDYGAQLGHVILGLARMELHNFYRNVMPVAEYFDQSGILIAVNGERNPSEVYIDFRDAVMKILGISEEGDNSRVRNPPGSVEAEVRVERGSTPVGSPDQGNVFKNATAATNLLNNLPVSTNLNPSKTANKPRKGLPYFIWVIGGPGSNKSVLSSEAVQKEAGWVHVSVGSLLRGMASSNPVVRDAILAGEIVPSEIVMQIVEKQVLLHRDTDGIVIDGFPRDSKQVEEFESKFGQEPNLLLLDCSKLQLGRGRLDDSVSAFRRRLEIFRELSLPMLKELDNENRLTIVDGDTDTKIVQDEFVGALNRLMRNSKREITEEGDKLFLENGESEVNFLSENRQQMANGFSKSDRLGNGIKSLATNGLSNGTIKSDKKFVNNLANNNNNNGISSISRKIHEDFMNNDSSKNFIDKKLLKNGNAMLGKDDRVRSTVLQANGNNNFGTNNYSSSSNNDNNFNPSNGIGNLVNGHLTANKVAPTKNKSVNNGKQINNGANTVKSMFNEVEGYQQDLHI